MSFRSGDRARAHKVNRKRRLRRSLLRVIRKVSSPSLEENNKPGMPEKIN
jgi:hypothetical protein